jgi:hypothetical protein
MDQGSGWMNHNMGGRMDGGPLQAPVGIILLLRNG